MALILPLCHKHLLAVAVVAAGLVLELNLVKMVVQEGLGLEHFLELLEQELQVKATMVAVGQVTVLMGLAMVVVAEAQLQQDKPLQEHRKEQVLQETVATELHG
jgi:hypothetical protein